MSRKDTSLSVVCVMAILAASLAAVTFGKLGIYSMAQGQGSQELTPEQKSAMCDPNDSFVNTTESKISVSFVLLLPLTY